MDLLLRSWTSLVFSVGAADLALAVLRLTLIGAIAHLALVLLRRAPAAARHVVAIGAVAVMLVTPLIVPFAGFVPALRIPVPAQAAGVVRGAAMPALARLEPVAPPAPSAPVMEETMAYAETVPTPELHAHAAPPIVRAPEPAPEPIPFAWPAAVLVAVAAVAWMLLWMRVFAALCGAWVVRGAMDAPHRLQSLLEAARRDLGLRTPVRLRLTDRIGVPAVAGIAWPVLLLPRRAMDWDDERLRPVLLHELAHVQRHDALTFALARIATAVLWFHPLSWTLARAARAECERACDDTVLRAGVRPSDYADQLLAIARGATPAERLLSMTLAFARPSSLEGRLLAILRPGIRRGPASRRMRGALVVALLLLLPVAAVRVVAEPVAPPSADEVRAQLDEVRATLADESVRLARIADTTIEAPDAPMSPSTDPCDPDAAAPAVTGFTAPREWADLGPENARSGEDWYATGKTLYDAGRFDVAGEAFERAARAGHDAGTAWYNAACAFARDGQRNRAIGALDEALRNGFDDFDLIADDDDLTSVRSDGRFRLLLESMMQEQPTSKDDRKDEAVTARRRTKHTKRTAAVAHDAARDVAPDAARDVAGDAARDVSGDAARHAARDAQPGVEAEAARGRTGRSYDPDSDDPHEVRSAAVHELREGDPRRAAALFQRQFSMDSSASALYNVACSWAVAGDKARALDALERSILAGYGDMEKFTGDDDLRAIHHEARFDRLVALVDDLDLDFPGGSWGDDDVEGWRGMLPRYQRATREHPKVGRAWFNLGYAELRARHPDASRTAFLHALDLGYRIGTTHYNLACAAAQSGDTDEALRRLATAEKAGMNVAGLAPHDDDLNPLRRDARFRDMLDRWSDDRERRAEEKQKEKEKRKEEKKLRYKT